ncbi:MAG: NAD(+)/NADH kinase [bacterium]|nr:NAD(+)/NADH kinase [bacterium]
MKTVALVVNVRKAGVREACAEIVRIIAEKGARVIADPESAAAVGGGAATVEAGRIREEAALVVSVGGDGTVLKAARLIAGAAVPLVGINMGGLGFLTAVALDGAGELLPRVLEGGCRAEERLLLAVSHARGGGEVSRHVALNDAVISKGELARLVSLETFVGEEYLATFVADGLIIASPTGSTAYSLSAGGPLVSPDTDAIIVTPICPHTLTNRPLIVPGRTRVRVRVSARAADTVLTLDGQESAALEDGDEVTVGGFGPRLSLVTSQEKGYCRLLREKLHWGGRGHHG